MYLEKVLEDAEFYKASDIHLSEGDRVALRVDGRIKIIDEICNKEVLDEIIEYIPFKYKEEFEKGRDINFSFTPISSLRCRANLFRKLGRLGGVLRIIPVIVPTFSELGLPNIFQKLAMTHSGLIIVTGPTGSGKTTSLASVLDFINQYRRGHIITIEDTIEFIHKPKMSIVSQREVGIDSETHGLALKSCLKEDLDVIFIDEMSDGEAIEGAITAAETGHLVFCTQNTIGAARSIERLLNRFPSERQDIIRYRLANVLQAVITQQLVRKIEGGRIAAFEIMVATPQIANMIREGNIFQILSVIQTGVREGMILLDNSLGQLVRREVIDFKEAYEHCVKQSELEIFAGRRL